MSKSTVPGFLNIVLIVGLCTQKRTNIVYEQLAFPKK